MADQSPAASAHTGVGKFGDFEVRAIEDADREWIKRVLKTYWATTTQVRSFKRICR